MFLKFAFQAGVFKVYREESSELSEEVGWKKCKPEYISRHNNSFLRMNPKKGMLSKSEDLSSHPQRLHEVGLRGGTACL